MFQSLLKPSDASADSYFFNSETIAAELLFSLAGCRSANPHCNPAKPHRMPVGFDLALIAVGAYQLPCTMQERRVNLVRAVQPHQDLKAERDVGLHFGTFSFTNELLGRPPKDLSPTPREQGLAADAFTVMAIGETSVLPARATP